MPVKAMFLLCCCLSLNAASAEVAVKEALARQQAAWNRGDVRAFMNEYLPSDELTFIGKQVTRGWQATLERYLKTYPTPDTMGKLTFSDVEVHALGKDHAWVLGRYILARSAEGGGNVGGRYTLIVVRTKVGWKIMTDHTSAD